MNQNLSHGNTNTVDLRTKFGLLIGFGIFVICVGISTILDYVKTPLQEPLSREIKALENIRPDIMVDPLVIKQNMDISVSVDGNQKLLNWAEFRIQRELNLSEPRGFRSVLQRRVEFDGDYGFLQIVEFNGSLEALHFIWYLPSNIRGDQGVQYDDSFWTISGRFLQVSPMKAFSSSKEQMALHKSIANNLGKSLLNLTSLLKSETLSFEKLKWDDQYLGEALKLKIANQNLFLIGSDALNIFDSGAYKLRNYSVGDTRLLRVISTNSSRTLLAKSLQSHVLISTAFARKLDLAQKYELQRLFQ